MSEASNRADASAVCNGAGAGGAGGVTASSASGADGGKFGTGA